MIILVAVAVVIYYAYRDVTEVLVIERNQEVTHLAAGQFAAELREYADLLRAEARTSALFDRDPTAQRDVLKAASNRLVVFDAGTLIFDTFGRVLAAEPERPEIVGQNWSDRAYYRQVLHAQPLGSMSWVVSDIVTDGPGDAQAIVMAVPISGPKGEFVGGIAGMFRVGATTFSAIYGDFIRLRLGNGGSAYLVDGQGQVIYHSDTGRIGEDLSAQGVVQQVIRGDAGAVRTRDLDNREIVASFAPVPGTPWGLVVEESWAGLIASSQGYRQFLLLLLVLGVAVPALVVAFGVRRITQPIVELARAAREVARGNFAQRISAATGDELEEMADQFNLMAAELQESYAHLEQRVSDRTKELAALNAIAVSSGQLLDLDEVLQSALGKTLEAMNVEGGGIYLLQEEAEVLTLSATQGLSEQFVAEIDRLQMGEGFSGRAAQSGRPLVVKDILSDPRLTRSAVREEGLRSLAIVPLTSKGKVLGTLFTVARDYREFTEQDLQLLTSISHQVGSAIDNARLFEQAQQAAVIKERSRLARELHDAVTQTLFSASLIAETLPRSWARDQKKGRRLLQELRQLSRGALAEMRTLLLELRPAALVETSLADLLHQLSEAATSRGGVPIKVVVEGECVLSTDVHIALYRIAQEALNNAIKHARAGQVTVHLRCTPFSSVETEERQRKQVELVVNDDGRGFNPAEVPLDHLGLGIMRERAEAIGATLEIESGPGYRPGTQIKATWKALDEDGE